MPRPIVVADPLRHDSMVDDLMTEQQERQKRTFTRWWNSWLSARGIAVTDLVEDMKLGVLPTGGALPSNSVRSMRDPCLMSVMVGGWRLRAVLHLCVCVCVDPD